MERAYSILTLKSADASPDGLTIRGIASTPSTDRVGDIVEPMGAKFKTPLPLFLYHDAAKQVGRVEFAKATPTGIPFEAFIPYVKEPGNLKDRVDEAIHMLKYRLLGAVSIGFKALEGGVEFMKNGGARYKIWEWLELSLVPIPANSEATITSVKQLVGASSSASTAAAMPQARSPAVPLSLHQGNTMNTAQRVEQERAGKMQAAKAMLEAVEKEGRTFDAEQQSQYDAILSDAKALSAQLDRIQEFDKLNERSASPVPGTVVLPQQHAPANILFQKSNDPPGIAVARVMRCLWMAKGSPFVAKQIAEQIYRDDASISQHFQKATVVAGSTISGTWGADALTTDGGPFAAFLEYLRASTIIGQIPGLRTVDFYSPVGIQTGGGAGYWIGEGKAKNLTSFDYDKTSLAPLTAANIVVVTKKWLKYAGINSDTHLRDELAAALRARIDTDFIDPAKAVDAGISPASITNGLASPASAGNTADDVREDVKTLLAALSKPLTGLVFITDTTTAIALSLMTNGLGQPEFPGMTGTGGRLAGFPVVVSDYVPAVTAGSLLIAVKAPEILVADEGRFNIDMSEDASLHMDDSAVGSSVASVTATTNPVSMFQTNSVAFRCERDMNWARARTGAVALVDSVNYGEGA